MSASDEPRPIVLVVEDNTDLRENVGECLDGEGFSCWLVATGDDALGRIEAERRSPDVVLLDLTLPGMPAASFVAALRSHAAWAGVPVVLTTGAREHEIPGDLHVDVVLPKPFRVASLLDTLRRAVTAAGPDQG